jgi:hypothetical protein
LITSHTIFGLSFSRVLYCPTAGVHSFLYLRSLCYLDSCLPNQFTLWLFFLLDSCTLSSDEEPFRDPAVWGRLLVALQAWLRAHRENKPRPVGSFSSRIILLERHLYNFMQLFFYFYFLYNSITLSLLFIYRLSLIDFPSFSSLVLHLHMNHIKYHTKSLYTML